MKKKIILLLFTILFISCSKDDDCKAEKAKITEFYDHQIQLCYESDSPLGIDYRKIGLLRDEKERKLAEACN